MCGPVLSLFGDLMGDYCGISCLYIVSFPLDRYSSMPFLGLCLDLSNNLFKLGSLSILLPPEPGSLPWDFYNIKCSVDSLSALGAFMEQYFACVTPNSKISCGFTLYEE